MKDEFVPMSLVGILALFASGYMLANGIDNISHGLPGAGDFFLCIMFALLARSEFKSRFASGTYTRRFLVWRRQKSE